MVDLPLMASLWRALLSRPVSSWWVTWISSVGGAGSILRDLIESGLPRVVRLTKYFRQAGDSRIVTSAHRINEGLLPELNSSEAASDFYFVKRDHPEPITDTLLNLVKARIPGRFGLDPVLEVQVLTPMNRGSLGVQE